MSFYSLVTHIPASNDVSRFPPRNLEMLIIGFQMVPVSALVQFFTLALLE